MKKIAVVGAIFLIGLSISYIMISNKTEHKNLKIYIPIDVKEEMVDSLLRRKGIGHRISNFLFEDQNGENISLKNVEGCVFVAEYFFTTCSTICPAMNREMKRVQNAFKSENTLKILSFTVDPEIDNVEQMNKYAKKHQAINGKWYFLTGEKSKLYELARKSFFVLKPSEVKNQGDANSDFIHTNNFVLIDKNLQIRGYYDGTSKKEVDKLIADIPLLLNE